MAIHSSILAYRISWTEEPGRATVHGVTKSRIQLSAHTRAHTHTHGRVKGSSLGNSGKTPAAFLTLLVLFFSP